MTGSAATSNHPTMTFDTLHAISSALHKERYARILPRQSLDVTNEINDTKKNVPVGHSGPASSQTFEPSGVLHPEDDLSGFCELHSTFLICPICQS